MTNWQQIADSGFAVPAGADAGTLARELAEGLADPDPAIGDGAAYSVLATWIRNGVLDDQPAWLGAAMHARFAGSRIQARTFAPLVLAWLIERGGFEQGGEPGPVPPPASNTMSTLRMLYLLADRGVRPAPDAQALPLTHREAVLGQLADTIAPVACFTG